MAAYTLSLHNGKHKDYKREHNRRNEKVTGKEKHINPNGKHENIIDLSPQEVYKEIFGEALKEYNEQQIVKGHPERCIKDYYKHICEDGRKDAVRELLVSIGNKDHQPPAFIAEMILKEYLQGWEQRNPHLKLVGAYAHFDEATPHLHLDYIGVATNQKRGLKTQNSLSKALEQQGFKTMGIHNTAQIQWQNSEREALENICRSYNLEIERPTLLHKEHLKIEEYKALAKIDDLQKEVKGLKEEVQELKAERDAEIDKYNDLVDLHTSLLDDISALEEGSVDKAFEIVDRYKERSLELIRE